jgi:diguanylate cyclase (GGDEF)-like protein
MYRLFSFARPMPWVWLGLAVLIFATCLLGIFARPLYFLSAFWPANALLLGLLVRYPHLARAGTWAAAAAAYVSADLVTGGHIALSLWLGAANLASVATGWWVLRHADASVVRLQRTAALLWLLGASLAAALVGALAGSAAGPAYFQLPSTEFLARWFSTELMNYLLILPVVLAAPRHTDPPQAPSTVPLVWRLAPVGSLVLAEAIRRPIGGLAMLAFVVPGLLWCALSYSPFVSSLLTLGVCLWTLASVASGVALFGQVGADEVFLLRMGITLLSLGPLAVVCANAARSATLAGLDAAVRPGAYQGVYTRRSFLDLGERVIAHHPRGSAGVAVVKMDIGPMEGTPDTQGAHTADAVMAAVAQALSATLRGQDLIVRIGVHAFGLVLPGISPADAQAIAERIRRTVQSHPVGTHAQGSPLFVSVRLGVVHSASMGGTPDLELMLLRAEAALYRTQAGAVPSPEPA